MTRPRPVILATLFALSIALFAACASDGARDEVRVSPVPSSTVVATTTSIPAASEPTSEPPGAAGDESGDAITIAAVGDLMLARDIAVLMDSEGPLYPFERVVPLFDDADLLIGNLEGTLTDGGEALDKRYTFRIAPTLAVGLSLAGFDAVSLANNHSFDFGPIGLSDTVATLEAIGVAPFGAGADQATASEPVIIEVRGQTVAFLGFDAIGGTQVATAAGPGVAWANEAALKVIAATERRADYVVVMVHAGIEYSGTPTDEQVAFARGAVDAGASVVIGHHPHALQPWEQYGSGLILYSLGNFVFDLDAGDRMELGEAPFQSAVATITLSPHAQPALSLQPVTIDVDENRPRPAVGDEIAGIEEALGALDSSARAYGGIGIAS